MNKIFALGFFDGVHLGHQALLSACCRMAREMGAEPWAVTFDKHPQTLFTAQPPKLINKNTDRVALLRSYGMEQVIIYPVTEQTMAKPWETFLEELTNQGATGFVCGSDFRFGCRGEGTAQKLQAYCTENGLACAIVEQQTMKGIRISSTHIRALLEAGDMAEANAFLGHPHVLTGQVVDGRKLGRTIGTPTANLLIPADVAAPGHGVYACKAQFDGAEYMAVTNVGTRPTVGGHRVTVESWLLDFAGDLYGKTLTLRFYEFLRPEQRFDSLEKLQGEIQKNALQTREIFEKS